MHVARRVSVCGFFFFAFFSSSITRADPVHIEAGVSAGVVLPVDDPSGPGAGIGLRTGIEAFGVYAGARAMFFSFIPSQQEDASNPPGGGGGGAENSVSAIAFGGELGYGLHIRRVVIRPEIGLGTIDIHRVDGSSDDTRVARFYLDPKICVLYDFTHVYIGGGIGAYVISEYDETRWPLHTELELGIRF